MNSLRDQRYRKLIARLKKARLDKGMNQSEVAELVKRPQSFMSKIENSERRLDALELCDLMRVYELDWNELTKGI